VIIVIKSRDYKMPVKRKQNFKKAYMFFGPFQKSRKPFSITIESFPKNQIFLIFKQIKR